MSVKSFMRGVLGATGVSSSAAKHLRISETPQPLHFVLSAFRWHLDSRPPSKVVAIHDYMSSSAAWEQLINESTGELPLLRLTPTEPLEVYSVDLRGHNFSSKVKLPDGENLALACAADIALLQQDILKTETKLAGVGFGALVACQAALHAPEKFSSMALFVRKLSQLFECSPTEYAIRDIVRSSAAAGSSFTEVNETLKKKLPNEAERAVLLSSLQQVDGKARFRFSDSLLTSDAVIKASPDDTDVRFDKPVAVFVADAKTHPPTDAELKRFQRLFPQGKIMEVKMPGGGLQSAGVPMVPMLLQCFGLLGEVTTEE